jgi:hypothetical protein
MDMAVAPALSHVARYVGVSRSYVQAGSLHAHEKTGGNLQKGRFFIPAISQEFDRTTETGVGSVRGSAVFTP